MHQKRNNDIIDEKYNKIYMQSSEFYYYQLISNHRLLSINIFIMQDYSNTSTDYLKSITIPPDIKLTPIFSQSNIIIKVGKAVQNTNQQSISINEEAMRKINSLFKQGVSQEMLQLFGIALVKQSKQFSKLFTNVPKIADTLSWAILKSLKSLQQKQAKLSESVYNSLIDGVLNFEKNLTGASTFKLFLVLVYAKAEQVLRKPLKQVIQYFPVLVHHISLIQVYVKNDKEQFKTIREIFRIANYIICWFSSKTIPKRLIDFIHNKQTQKMQRNVAVYQADSDTLNKFYQIVIRYGLVDPEYRQNLLKIILEIFANSLQNQNTIELYRMCIILMNKRIFDQYQQKIFFNLDHILDNYVKLHNRQIFIKIIKGLISEKDHSFFIQNKKYLLKFGISQEVQVEFFSQYYGMLKNPKLIKYCDNDIFNKLIEWNIKYSIIPLHQFLENLLKISSPKINTANQKLIYNSDSKLWYPIIQKIAEQKIKQFIQSRKSVSSSSTITLSVPSVEAEDFNKVSQIYIIYTQKLFLLITGMDYKKYAESIETSERNGKAPISTITINENKQNMENVKSIREYSNIILERAIKNKMMDLKFLEAHLILRSLTEIIRVKELDNTSITKYYIQCIKIASCERIMTLLPHLLNTFRICKNAFTLYIILCCSVSFFARNGQKTEEQVKFIRIIQEVVKLIKFGDFTKITSFHSENIKLIIILSYLSPQLKKISMDFLMCWASLFTKSDIELLIYQFDARLFSYYLQEFQIQEKFSPETQVAAYIFQTMKLILNLLNSPSCSSSEYLTNTNNCIFFMPIRHQKNKKNSLHLQFKVLINPNLCCNSSIQFYGSPRSESINVMQKNRIVFQNKEIIFYNRNSKKIEASYSQPKNELYERPFVIGIRISNSKFIMEVNKNEIMCTDYNFSVDTIRFDLNGDILLKQLKWRIFEHQQHILEYNNSHQIFPSEVQIKVSKLNSFSLKSFQDKINLEYLCFYFEEIIRVNFIHVDLNQFYEQCSAIILAKEGALKNQYTNSQFLSMKKLFRNILKCSENVKKIEITQILKQKQEENKKTNILKTKKFYQFLICSAINQKFLNQTTNDGKKNLLRYLSNLLFDQSIGFLIENRKTTIFATITKFITRIDGQIRDQYSELLINILLNHEVNQVLLKKISILFSYSYSNKSEYLQKLLDNFFQKIVSVISVLPTEQNYHLKAIGKFILSQYKNLQYIFLMTSTDIKLKILDNMIEDEQLSPKCHAIFKNLPEEELLELSDRIIVYSKKAIFDYFDAKRQNQLNLSNMLFFLKQLTEALPILTEQSHKQDTISILSNFMKKSNKLFTNKEQLLKLNPTVIQKLQSFYCYPSFVRLIGRKIQMYNAEDIKNESHQTFIFTYFNILFSVIPKLLILKALSEFQKSTENAYESCLYILSLDAIVMLPERALSAFLQYLLQMLIMVRSQKQQSRTKKLGQKVHECLQKITKNYAKVSHISRPLLYSYPKLQKVTQINNSESVKKSIIAAKQAELFEMKGGIFFKLLCIVFHLFEIFSEQDLSYYIVFFLDKICHDKNKNNNEAVYRATNDFIQVNKDVKNRSPLDLMIKQIQKEHLKYFQNEDEQMIIIKSSPVRRTQSGKPIDLDLDLTPFFVDFFLMKLFIYLENHCKKYASQEQIKVLQKYSKETLYYLKSFQQIWDEMNEKNSESIINYERVEDLYTLIDQQEDQLSDRLNSPQVNHRLLPSHSSNRNITFEEMNNNFQLEGNFLGTPKKSSLRRRSSLNFDLTSGKKKKKEIISAIQSNIHAWSEEGKKKQMHKFFRDQSKEILFYELLHQLYARFSVGSQKQTHLPKAKRIMGFVKDQQEKHYEEEQTVAVQKNQKIVIRKVYRFTSEFIPKLKLKRNLLPNSTYPFVNEIQHQIKASSSHITPELLLSLKSQQMSEPESNQDNLVCLQNKQESNLDQQNICEISQPAGVYFCVWELTNQSIMCTSKSEKQAKGNYNKRIVKYGSPVCNIIKEEGKKIQVQIKDVHEIFFRKYNQVRDNSLQFFFKNGYSVYFVFYTKQRTLKFIQKCKKKFEEFHLIKIVDNHMKSFQSQNYTQKWASGQINNFDYLMLVNKYAGRTFCDLNQYYIFPWVLEDYTSKILDISNFKIYRDLKKPIGALRESKLQKYLQKISKSGEPNEQYLYGSHYSTSLFIYYYLVRLEPFTSLHKDMQSGEFDAADRLFSSIEQMWECLMSQSSTSDIKEAIPEFYYFPTFLKNINSLNFGKKQSGQTVNHVQLPPWASSPADFILKMRACLESDYVSANLNYWIDLIFGKDQKSFQKNNVFHSLCYVENITPEAYPLNSLDAIMSQITFFGQNPYVLFTKQHPKKKVKDNSVSSSNLSLYTSLDLSSKQNLKRSISKIYESQNLEDIYYISEMFFKTKNIITIKITVISKESETKVIQLNMQHAILSLCRAIQKREPPVTSIARRLLSQNNIEIPYEKVSVNYEINQQEIKFSIGVREKTQIVHNIKLQYNFQSLRFNQTVLVVYGSCGLRVYDWNQDLIWKFPNELGQVSQCFLETGLIFFTTSTGKLFVYDFLVGYEQTIYEYAKQTCEVKMLVYPQNKFITKKNEYTYKFLLVGDKRKIILLHYTHRVGKLSFKN